MRVQEKQMSVTIEASRGQVQQSQDGEGSPGLAQGKPLVTLVSTVSGVVGDEARPHKIKGMPGR